MWVGKNGVASDALKQKHGGESNKEDAALDNAAGVDDDEAVNGDVRKPDNNEEKKIADEQERSEKASATTAGTIFTTTVTGYKKYSRLRTLPPQYVRPRTVRMCYDDMAPA